MADATDAIAVRMLCFAYSVCSVCSVYSVRSVCFVCVPAVRILNLKLKSTVDWWSQQHRMTRQAHIDYTAVALAVVSAVCAPAVAAVEVDIDSSLLELNIG